MKNATLGPILLSMVLASMLTLAGTQITMAQTTSDAQSREALLKTLISTMEAQLKDAQEVSAKQEQLIKLQQEQLADFRNLDKNTAMKIAVMEEQIKVLLETRTQLQTQLTAKDTIIQEQNSRIANRDQMIDMIRELTKATKRSAWERLVDAFPSVAAIIALGVAQ